MLDSGNAQCLYGLASQHAGVCPAFHVTGRRGKQFREATGVAFAVLVPGLAETTQTAGGGDSGGGPASSIQQESGFVDRDLNGPKINM